jgi:hypothetical protein
MSGFITASRGILPRNIGWGFSPVDPVSEFDVLSQERPPPAMKRIPRLRDRRLAFPKPSVLQFGTEVHGPRAGRGRMQAPDACRQMT